MSQATDRLTASAAALAASVDAAVSLLGRPVAESPEIAAVADTLDAAKAKLDAAVAVIASQPA